MIRALAVAAVFLAFGAAPASAADSVDCTVSGATMTWGFKESFRSYISGSIANGKWSVSDGATYATPSFGFSGGSGDLAGRTGDVAFAGAIEFTGHAGILDTTVSNPTIRFDGTSHATLLLDVSGTTQQGAAVDSKAVPFASIDLADAKTTGGEYVLDAAPATLTAEGAAAFGTYAAGEALDPISAEFPVPAECAPKDLRSPWAIPAAIAGGVLLVGAIVALVFYWRWARRAKRAPFPEQPDDEFDVSPEVPPDSP